MEADAQYPLRSTSKVRAEMNWGTVHVIQYLLTNPQEMC